MAYIVESGVPLPKLKYPWKEMQVGDSVRFGTSLEFIRARTSAHAYARRRKFAVNFKESSERKRIWRIK